MNQEVKQNWLEALRSGNYQQTQKALRDENGYCCLGVLCDILVGVKGEWSGENNEYYEYDIHGSDTDLPTNLRKELEISEAEEVQLVQMNDDGSTFTEIASYIEANL